MIGQTISHYKILEKLGEGGMGVVYKAHDTALKRYVALKFLPQYLTSDQTEKERFYHEAQSASALNHPNITTIYEIAEHESQLFIAMEYVEGQTLKNIVGATHASPLQISKILDIAIQVCDGLAAAHEKGIVHRDIKCENIMMTPKGQVKIMDFGLAKVKGATKLTKTGSTLGTAAYMSPEQARGEEIDQRSDIFSLGVVLYEMITAHLPFRGEHIAAIQYSIINEQPAPLARFNEKVTDELQHIVSKALEKDREDRYQHVDDLLADLRRERKKMEYAKAGYATTAGEPTPSATKIIKRKQRIIIPLIATSLAMIVVATLMFLFLFQKKSIEINPDRKQRPIELPFTEIGYPDISDDGNQIAFMARDPKGIPGLYIMNAVQGSPRRITTLESRFILSVNISPDGGLLYFGILNSETNRIDNYKMFTNDSARLMVVEGGGISYRFHPTGQRVGYIMGTSRWTPSTSGKPELWSVGVDGSEAHREFIDSIGIAGPSSFSYSPDGMEVAWLRTYSEGYQEVIIHNLETRDEKIVTSDKKNIDEVAWIKEDKIAYTSNKNGVLNVWTTSTDGGEPLQITNVTEPAMGVRVSANGQRLIYLQHKSTADFWVFDLTKNRSQQITFTGENQHHPSFSPDGKKIAFIAGGGMSIYDPSHLYIMNRDGSNRIQLTFGDEVVGQATWSTDSKWLAYESRKISEPFDSIRTYIIDPLKPGSSKFITHGLQYGWLDSANIQIKWKEKLFAISFDGAIKKEVSEDSTFSLFYDGGKYVLFQDYSQGKHIGVWIVEAKQAQQSRRKYARILTRKSTNLKGMDIGSGNILYQLRGVNEIWRVTLPDGKEERIPGDFRAFDLESFAPSWDGKEIIVTDMRHLTKIVLIENLFK